MTTSGSSRLPVQDPPSHVFTQTTFQLYSVGFARGSSESCLVSLTRFHAGYASVSRRLSVSAAAVLINQTGQHQHANHIRGQWKGRVALKLRCYWDKRQSVRRTQCAPSGCQPAPATIGSFRTCKAVLCTEAPCLTLPKDQPLVFTATNAAGKVVSTLRAVETSRLRVVEHY